MKLLQTILVRALVILMFAAAALAAPKDAIILLDASWSMQGFFETSSICGIVDDIRTSLIGTRFAVRHLGFKDEGFLEEFRNCDEVRADGNITLIDTSYENALKRQPKASVIWLITDNVQDPKQDPKQPNRENDDIRQFYNVLEQDRVARVYVFIRTPDFNGPVYKRDGKTRLGDGDYPGKRGLLIYGILLDPGAGDDFEKTIKLFAERSRGKVPVDIAEGTPVKGFTDQSVKAAIEKVDAPQVTIRKSDNALVFQKVFREQEPIQGTFDINFLNGPANLEVDRPEIDVAQKDGFRLYGDLSAEVPEVSAAPPQLDGKLLPASSATGAQRVRITISFPQGVTFPHSVRALWNYLWQPHAALYKGSIKVGLKTRVRDVRFAEAVIQSYDIDESYFTRPEAQQRIYGLKSLFQQLHNTRGETPITIPAEVIPVEFSVSPPQWPLVVLIVLALMLLGIMAMMGRTLGGRQFQLEPVGPHSYRLDTGQKKTAAARTGRRGDDANAFAPAEGSFSPDLKKSIRLGFLGSHTIREENERLGELRRKPGGITVAAARGYVVNGSSEYRLPGRGGSFSFQRPTDAGSNHDGLAPKGEVSQTTPDVSEGKREVSDRSRGSGSRNQSGSDNYFG